jgi:four helix bundle protein
MAESILRTKSYAFALKVIKVYKQIIAEKKEYVLGKQFLDAGAAIGALIREAEFAQSKADFISKMNISLKESNETEYWICLLRDSDFITKETADDLNSNNQELLRMLVSSIKTPKQNSGKPLTNK